MNTYTVGQEVGYGRSSNYGNWHSTGFGSITKINSYGHITVMRASGTTVVFDKRGYERGTNYGLALLDATYLRTTMADDMKRRDRRAAVDSLMQKLEGTRGHNGNAWVSKETKAELLAMLEAIETTD